MKKYEYIWLDGYQPEQSLRSKIKATTDETAPGWNFDGSSTQQAGGGESDCGCFNFAS
jgi:glutamine synthetase